MENLDIRTISCKLSDFKTLFRLDGDAGSCKFLTVSYQSSRKVNGGSLSLGTLESQRPHLCDLCAITHALSTQTICVGCHKFKTQTALQGIENVTRIVTAFDHEDRLARPCRFIARLQAIHL